jgi:hypothetical protein
MLSFTPLRSASREALLPIIPRPLLEQPEQFAPPAQQPIPNKGGAPPKPWWDDLWSEMFRQIYTGDLVPKRQADIERAMLDWAASRGTILAKARSNRGQESAGR